MRIACIGDSVTFGQNVRSDEAWPHVLYEMTDHDVRNLGVNGDTTRLALERWNRDVALSKPDLVVIQFGHNDANLWHERPRVTPEEFEANISAMIRLSPRAIVIAPHNCEPPKDYVYNTRLNQYRSTGILVDVDILDDGYGCHPSVEGHKVYAEEIRELL